MFRSVSNAVILALVGVVALIGAIVLAALHDPIPEFVPSIALAAIGALAGVALPQAVVTSSAVQPTSPAPEPTTPVAAVKTITAVPPAAA